MAHSLPATRRYGKLKIGFRQDFDFIVYNSQGIGEVFCHKADCIGITDDKDANLRVVPEDFVAKKGMSVGFGVINTARGPRASPWWFVEDPPPAPKPPPIDWSQYDRSSTDVQIRQMFGRLPSRECRFDVREFHESQMMLDRVRMEHEKRVAERTDKPVLFGKCTCLIYPERVYAQQESGNDRHPNMAIDSTFYVYRVVRAHSNCPLHSWGNPIEFYIFRDNGEHPLDSEMVSIEGVCDDSYRPYCAIEQYWNRWLREHGYSVDDGYDE